MNKRLRDQIDALAEDNNRLQQEHFVNWNVSDNMECIKWEPE